MYGWLSAILYVIREEFAEGHAQLRVTARLICQAYAAEALVTSTVKQVSGMAIQGAIPGFGLPQERSFLKSARAESLT